ncbi:VolA/Pla-1 family phospholipase [Thalassotalea mangrovi]|uniref:Lipase n=1 Tax=Thalassotalea mangrovi TaxID=2572245 RepID=A0A4U1B694_9GAMM|nr:VolA/Pla-1 family phospholipase [Thalassotalea mangrovi]TKB45938.1 lipase [Thalassotalea mangrovi]
MKKLLLCLAVSSALGLSGCDSESIDDVINDNSGEAVKPTSTVAFDPLNEVLSFPNNILFSDTTDGTLNLPVDDPKDLSDPLVAANALDGWSTNQPFIQSFVFPEGVGLDPVAIYSTDAVSLYEVALGGDAECPQATRGVACAGRTKLVLGEDYIVQAAGNDLAIVPLKPLKAKTSYVLALTNRLLDTDGMPIGPSSTYELIRTDISTPLADASQLALQAQTNSFEDVVESFGIQREDIIYTAAFTTQSVEDALMVTKQLLAASLNPATQLFPTPAVAVQATGITAAQALGFSADPQLGPLFSTAKLYSGSVTLPYYLGTGLESTTKPWTAMCDSGAMLAAIDASTLPEGPIEGTFDAACMQFGLRDIGIDEERNITKFNPIPKVTELQTVEVQMTIPDPVVANQVRPVLGMQGDLVEPANGWPVVILQHGVTGNKGQMLALSGILSAAGYATVAIDHPLHASRGVDLTGDGNKEIDASTNPFAYMNIANLLNARDNLRQSTTDLMALRLGLNFANVNIDASQTHFIGASLGGIVGLNFMATTNTSFNTGSAEQDAMLNAMFNVKASTLSTPGGGIPNFLLESASFENIVKANLAYSASPEFKAFADATLGAAAADPVQLAGIWPDFIAALTPAQLSAVNSTFSMFAFAAQSIIDAGDPLNYATMAKANMSPIHLIEVVGNGMDNLPDQVIPNTVSTHPLAGSSPLIETIGMPVISQTTMSVDGMPISGAVKFVYGHHGSLLTPAPTEGSPSVEFSARATQEMQTQAVTYFLTGATVIPVNDSEVVLQ